MMFNGRQIWHRCLIFKVGRSNFGASVCDPLNVVVDLIQFAPR